MTETRAYGSGRPLARADVVLREVGDDWMLYDPRTGDLHVLNATAVAVWACSDGTLDVEGIAGALVDSLEGAPGRDDVRRDVRATLERFRAADLLEAGRVADAP